MPPLMKNKVNLIANTVSLRHWLMKVELTGMTEQNFTILRGPRAKYAISVVQGLFKFGKCLTTQVVH